MVGVGAHFRRDARGVLPEGVRVDAAGDGPAAVDLLHHRVLARDGAVLRDGRVRVVRQAHALLPEGAASHGHVRRRALPVRATAHAVLDLAGASKVRLCGHVGDAAALGVGDGLEPLVRAVDGAAVAGAHVCAVEDVLDGELDVRALGLARNLDAVAKGRDRAVRPTRTAILGDMLVQGGRAVVHAILVAPAELRGKATGGRGQAEVRRLLRRVAAPDDAERLRLLARQELALPAGGRLRLQLANVRLAIGTVLIAVDLVVPLRRREIARDRPSAAPLEGKAAAGDADVALLAPVLAP
mmetsp:Transcript_24948/g.77571  ORF Transcript_24948/g.77571 Transcript_24948/m.77571 type:complete len:298 (+) Transcript_24948:530-1423(+)